MVRRLATAAVVLAMLALTGCQEDDPEPIIPDPTPTEASSPSETATETETPETPEEFVEAWVEATNELLTSGRSSAYGRLAGSCKSCRQTQREIAQIYEVGGSITGGTWSITSVEDLSSPEAGPGARARIEISGLKAQDTVDGPIREEPAMTVDVDFALDKSTDGLVMFDYSFRPVS